MYIYDCIVIGSGPAGLTFATLADKKEKIMIIEKDKFIGGCHKVNRQKYENEYYFSEHGPRMYFSNYLNFKMVLNKIGLKFNDVFVRYKLSMFQSLYEDLIKPNILNFNEIMALTISFFKLMVDPNYAKNLSLHDFMKNNNFTETAINYVDRNARIADGGDISKISLNTYLSILNETLLYNAYQPKLPNDDGLFNIWKNNLTHIDFKFDTAIIKIEKDKEIIKLTSDKNDYYYAKKIILAIPPVNLYKIIENSPENIRTINDLAEYSEKTNYNKYISVTFHWNYEIKDLPKKYGFFNNTEWGIINIVLTDYMKFKEKSSKTVISCCISYLDKKSKYINKTANECNDKNEIIYEMYRQLKEIYQNLPLPTLAFMNNYYENGEWKSHETAFLRTYDCNYIKNNRISDNIYILGTHSGNSKIHYTSLESAVTNAIHLVNVIYKTDYNIKRPFTVKDLIIIIIILIILIIIILNINIKDA
jgi:protoporphyrinogen oxidase